MAVPCGCAFFYGDDQMSKKSTSVPVIILKDMTIFPGMIIHFETAGSNNLVAVEKSISKGSTVVVMSQTADAVSFDKSSQTDTIGTLATVVQLIKVSPGVVRILLTGKSRVHISKLDFIDKSYMADIEHVDDNLNDLASEYEKEALLRGLKDVFNEYSNEYGKFSKSVLKKIAAEKKLGQLIDLIATNIPLEYENRQHILITVNIIDRYNYLVKNIVDEVEILRIRQKFQDKVKKLVDDNQKEYYLREQLRVIREELGDSSADSEADIFEKECNELDASDEIKERILVEIHRFKTIASSSSESAVVRGYIETLLELPWNKKSEDDNDIVHAEKVLNKNHYGLKKVKERILESLAVRLLTGKGDAPIICLVGPPGTGKTSIAKSVAEALNKKYIRICLGGVRDEAEIRGHRKTYVGAMPGRIANALKKAKVSNPLILLDEIDKVSNDYKGDTFSALLEVLDSEQNEFFTDNYVELPVDLSNVLFICTANSTQTIPGPLLDRMEIIQVSGYTENEKFHIAKEHLVNKQKEKNGVNTAALHFADSAIKGMILNYTREAGVRNLERRIAEICRKAAKQIVTGETVKVNISARKLEECLGKAQYESTQVNKQDEVGIVRGLAWTSVGGETLEIEVNVMHGKGKFELTGQLGDVMKESAMTAISYVRSLGEQYNIADDFFEEHDIHIHIPEGAVPKDGPSAGITMATAILSTVTGIKIKADLAMTGEITLRGRVLPIGGLKEKILAAKNARIHNVLVPEKNLKDIEEMESEITEGITIRYVENMKQVIEYAFNER